MGSLLTSLCLAVSAAADIPYVVRHWGTERGLPPGPGATMLQTRDGHIWLGMEEGLVRLGGGDAVVFDSYNTPEMKGNSVTALFEDRNANLWAANGKWGLLRLTGGKFTRFGREAGLTNEKVSGIAEDRRGTLWVGTDGGGLFRLEGGRFVPVAPAGLEHRLFVGSLACTPDGALWVAYEDALCRIQSGDVRVHGTNELGGSMVETLHVDKQGQLWVAGRDFLVRQHDGGFQAPSTNRTWNRISAIADDPDHTLWLATAEGVVRLREGESTLFDTSDGLAGNLITGLIVDREGSVWLSNNASGVDQLKPSRFEVLGVGQGLSHSAVTSVLEDSSGALWLATEEGINLFRDGVQTVFKQEQGLTWDMVFTLAEGPTGTLWAGTWKGLNRFVDGAFRPVTDPSYPSGTTWCSYVEPSGTVWFGTPRGLAAFQDGQFRTWNHENSGLSHDDVRCVLRDRQGRLWVGTSYGLNRLDGDRFRSFFEAAPDQPFDVVLSLHEDAEGGIWFGTQGDGLFRFRDDRFTRFTTEHGLFDNLAFAIVEDELGFLWLTSNRGLFRVAREQLDAVARGDVARVGGRVFTVADGLPTAAFNGTVQPVAWKARDGRIWFATTAGAVAVKPGSMFTNRVPPAVSVESIAVNGRRVSPDGETLIVPPGSERLTFSYAVLSYVSPAAVRSRYRMEGFDKDWVTNAAHHEVQYTALKPGTYRFHVAAVNGDGVWNEAGAALAVVVRPFVWQTVWFQVVSGALVLGLLIWSVQALAAHRHRVALESLERRHALERERMRIASDLHDDVGSNLGSIALLSRDVERRTGGDADVAGDVAEITRLARETADSMRDIVWFINPDEDTVEKMVLRMKDVVANLRGGLPFSFEASERAAGMRLSPQFKRQFFLIFKESLHNIHKHARASKVVIRLLSEAGGLELEVEDDGRGFAPEGSDRGTGLGSMHRRAAERGWRLEILSAPGRGTRIKLKAGLT